MEFKPQRSRKTGKAVWILAAAFIVFNGWIFIFAGTAAGFVMTGFSVLLLLFVVFETGRFGWSYIVSSEGIGIKRTFRKYLIALGNIDSAREISLEGIDRIIAGIKNRKGLSGQKKTGGVSLQIELGRLIGYSSLPINISEIKPAARRHRADTPAAGQYILLTKKDGKQYILTPFDIKGFLQACRQIKRSEK